MRFIQTLKIGFIVTISLALMSLHESTAQETNGQQKFGTINCQQAVPCLDSGDYLTAPALASLGNTCLQGLGINRDDGFFDESAGLNANQCMTIKSELLSSKDSKTILPKCCVVKISDNNCIMHCELLNNW